MECMMCGYLPQNISNPETCLECDHGVNNSVWVHDMAKTKDPEKAHHAI